MSEFDRSAYKRVNSPGSPDCSGLRTAILRAIGKSNRQEILKRFIAENCANCSESEAIVFDQDTDDIWVKKDSTCANSDIKPRSPNPPVRPTGDSPLDDY